MSQIAFLLERFRERPDTPAVVFRGSTVTYGELLEATLSTQAGLRESGIAAGDVVVLVGDYAPETIATLLALSEMGCVIVPVTPAARTNVGNTLPKVKARWEIDFTGSDTSPRRLHPDGPDPELYSSIREAGTPGLVLFTSGSSGRPKAVVHDFARLLRKFHARRKALVTINFLLFDHWGGLNTLLHCLSNHCLVVIPEGRTPEKIAELVERHRVELLPTTPSFLSMLVISGAHERHDMSSLQIISYGAEPMPASTLQRLHAAFPDVDLRQTYGMIELGVLRAKTRSPDSLWMKMGGEGYDLRVVDGILQIKAASAMLGYIDEPSPYTDDGYFITGDRVEVDGEWMHVLGRESDLINVGGQKAYPAEIESAIFGCECVDDAIVYGERNPLLGSVVAAQVVLKDGFAKSDARVEIVRACREQLTDFMVPSRVKFVDSIAQTHRLKRNRRLETGE